MKLILKPFTYTLSSVICLLVLFSFDMKTNLLPDPGDSSNATDTLTLLQSRKWIQYWNEDTVSSTMTFDGNIVSGVDYEEGECSEEEAFRTSSLFYLSNSRDKAFNMSKVGNRNGKYLIFQVVPYYGTNDDAKVFKILTISPDTLKFIWVRMHGEIIAGKGGPVTCVGKPKTN